MGSAGRRPLPAGGRTMRLAPLLLPVVVAASAATVVLVQGFGEPFSFWGDKAVEETAVQQATELARGFGARSNWDFFHPGPLMFYLLSPLYWLTGNEPLAISIGALLVNTAAGLGVIVAVDRFLGQVPATVAAFLVALHFWAWSGPGVWEHWNPALVPLPLLLACVLWAGAWSGSWRWLLAGWLPASFAVQTHLGALPLVLAAFSVGAVGAVRGRRDRRRTAPEANASPAQKLTTASLVAVLVLVWVPPLWQQATSTGDGNLQRVVEITLAGPELQPGMPGGWTIGQSWRAVANEATRVPFGWKPAPSPTLPADLGNFTLPTARALLWLGSLGLATGMIAWGARTGRWAVVGLSAMTVATAAAAVVATTRVPAKLHNYQLWGSATSLLPAWIALGTVVTGWIRSRHTHLVPVLGTVVSLVPVLAFVAALRTPTSEPFAEQAVAVAGLVRQEVGDGRSLTLDWVQTLDVVATGTVATLRREGLDVRVPAKRAGVYSEDLTASGTEDRRLLLAPPSASQAQVAALQPPSTCPIARVGEVAGVEVWRASPRC